MESGHAHRFNRYIRPILNLFYLSLCNRRLPSPPPNNRELLRIQRRNFKMKAFSCLEPHPPKYINWTSPVVHSFFIYFSSYTSRRISVENKAKLLMARHDWWKGGKETSQEGSNEEPTRKRTTGVS